MPFSIGLHPGRRTWRLLAALCSTALALGCANEQRPAPVIVATPQTAGLQMRQDIHSFARPDEAKVEHLDLDLSVDFESRRLQGRASLRIESAEGAERLHLDTRDLDIEAVTLEGPATAGGGPGAQTAATYLLAEPVPYLGRELTIDLRGDTRVVHVDYATRPEAAAVQWLTPEQTAGGEHPFLFTQSQAILARTWVPCQDTPAVRMTYSAVIRTPPALMAVMSAENSSVKSPDGVYTFDMPQAIPSYLLALAVGELEFRALGPQSGVFAEPTVVGRAAWEFAETEAMMAAVARLYGPYRWGRYDILVLPPSFPFGGMENPRLTFATPTILAGDRSLVALIAHELAHSWSGNLVTNATWDDFWLNEGFTVYLERRIMEELHGREHSEMLALLGRQDLEGTFDELGAEHPDTHLRLALHGRDPDDGMTDIAYEKGYFFLRSIEEAVGRERFDAFLREYFDRFAFESLTTDEFLAHLQAELVGDDAALAKALQITAWVDGPGLPEGAPEVTSAAFSKVDRQLAAWDGGTSAEALEVETWTTAQWLHFLRGLPAELGSARMRELDAAFAFSSSGNSEILNAWLLHAIDNQYEPAYEALEGFLVGQGRRKFLKPLYEHLAASEEGLRRAKEIYARARPGYHSVSAATIDDILGWNG